MTNDKIRLSVKAFGQRYTASVPNDSHIDVVTDAVRGLLCAIGYSQDTVFDAMGEPSIGVEDILEDEVLCNDCACNKEKTTVSFKVKLNDDQLYY